MRKAGKCSSLEWFGELATRLGDGWNSWADAEVTCPL